MNTPVNQDLNPEELLTGLKDLSASGVIAVSEISEALHQCIVSMGGVLDTSPRTRGITGMVYRNIRNVTQLSSALLDPPLRFISRQFPQLARSDATLAVLSALNGVLGDHLQQIHHPFALPMTLRRNGILLQHEDVQQLANNDSGQINLFIHGLCMNDLQWQSRPGNYGDNLESEAGIPAIYLRYNTGLHISQNGQNLAHLLEDLDTHLPRNVTVNVIAHSMGGLVCRAALHAAAAHHMHWPLRVKRAVFLGTPHQGAPLEKVGHWTDRLLALTPYSRPFSRLTRVRSNGINDLREGYIVASDWQHTPASSISRTPVLLPSHLSCHCVAASTAKQRSTRIRRLPGDGLVSVASALGQHADKSQALNIPEARQHLILDAHHMDLLSNHEVANKLVEICT